MQIKPRRKEGKGQQKKKTQREKKRDRPERTPSFFLSVVTTHNLRTPGDLLFSSPMILLPL